MQLTLKDAPQVRDADREVIYDFSDELHHMFVEELRLRRIKHIDLDMLLRILHYYVVSGTLMTGSNSQDASQQKFI